MKLLLATGNHQLNQAISKKLEGDIKCATSNTREGVFPFLKERTVDTVIISDHLKGEVKYERFLHVVSEATSDVKVIYLLDENDISQKTLLYQNSIFNVIVGEFKVTDLESIIFDD